MSAAPYQQAAAALELTLIYFSVTLNLLQQGGLTAELHLAQGILQRLHRLQHTLIYRPNQPEEPPP